MISEMMIVVISLTMGFIPWKMQLRDILLTALIESISPSTDGLTDGLHRSATRFGGSRLPVWIYR